jgi:hypothetical protein|tara:strand:+ start:144 stop:257 length:114 start_codon:yes stop_codon:yes gene_type:complete
MNDPLAERYYNIIKEKVKKDYYWEQLLAKSSKQDEQD